MSHNLGWKYLYTKHIYETNRSANISEEAKANNCENWIPYPHILATHLQYKLLKDMNWAAKGRDYDVMRE